MTLVGSIHRIFRNDGIGMFTATVTADLAFTEATSGTGSSRYIRGMAIADTDGDGLMDVYTVKTNTGSALSASRVETAKRNRNEGFTVKRASESEQASFQEVRTGSFGRSGGVQMTKAMAFGDCEPRAQPRLICTPPSPPAPPPNNI